MNRIEIRNAKIEDAHTLAYIQTESWKVAFKGILTDAILEEYTEIEKYEAMYTRILNNPTVHMAIEYVDEKPHGITAWSQNRAGLHSDVAELICIHSLSDQWRKGYGSAMMTQTLDAMKDAGFTEVILWVFEKNQRARAFYEKHGFMLQPQTKVGLGTIEVMYARKL